jgi:release factor glutamine methyltransferase
MTIAELQREFLTDNKRIAPEDFFILLAHVLGKDKVFILSHPEYKISAANESRARNFFFRRMHNEPVAYVLGYKEFYGRNFIVTKDTLIPRPETEMIVDLAIEEIKKLKAKRIKKISVVDVGTGSGNIIISLAKQPKIKNCEFWGLDISKNTLTVALRNAKKHNVNKKIKFLQSDLLEKLWSNKIIKQSAHIIITANLPYLSPGIYNNTAKDVRDFEPKNALISGQKGLTHYYRLLKSLKNTGKPQSITLFLEISPEQKFVLKKYASKLFFGAQIEIKKDLAGKARVLEIHVDFL